MTSGPQVTILALNYSPEPTGNAPYTTGLAQHLARDHSVTAVTGFPHYPQWARDPAYPGLYRVTESNGVTLRRLAHWIPRPPRGVRRLLSEVHFGMGQVFSPWDSPAAAVLVSPALFASALCAVRLRLPLRVPHAVWVQDLYAHGMVETGEGSGLAVRVTRAVEGWLLRGADAVVTIHPTMASRVAEDYAVPADRVHVIHNWSHVTPSPATQAQARATLGWDPAQRIVLHCGNMGRKQGLSTVVEAARLARERGEDVTFILLGDGAERAHLEDQARGIPTLRFIDPIDEANFPAALAAADVLLVNELPGVKEMAVPSKLTSYFAAGRPVLGAVDPAGIVAGILDSSRAGRHVRSGDAGALLDAALCLLDDPRALREGGEAGTAYWHANLAPDSALGAWSAVVDSLMRGRRPR